MHLAVMEYPFFFDSSWNWVSFTGNTRRWGIRHLGFYSCGLLPLLFRILTSGWRRRRPRHRLNVRGCLYGGRKLDTCLMRRGLAAFRFPSLMSRERCTKREAQSLPIQRKTLPVIQKKKNERTKSIIRKRILIIKLFNIALNPLSLYYSVRLVDKIHTLNVNNILDVLLTNVILPPQNYL